MAEDNGPVGSPRLLSPSLLTITFCCVVGDEFKVYDFGLPILTGSLDLPLARLFPFVIRTRVTPRRAASIPPAQSISPPGSTR